MRIGGFLVALMTLGACAIASDQPVVGIRSSEVADASRQDSEDIGRSRTWRVDIYYPALGERNAEPRAYAPDSALVHELIETSYYGMHGDTLQSWRTRSSSVFENERPRTHASAPLIVLAPGLGVAGFNYAELSAELVRRGVVVAFADLPHLGVSRLSDGRLLTTATALESDDPAALSGLIDAWVRDLSVTIDHTIATSPVPIDPARIAVVGHSLGGAVALDACRADPRVRVCMDFEGAPLGTQTFLYGPRGAALFVLSLPHFSPEEEAARVQRRGSDRPDFQSFLAQGEGVGWFVSVTGGAHLSYSDAPLVMPETLTRFGGSVMTPERSMSLYADMTIAFARAHWPGGGGDAAFASFLQHQPEVRGERVARQ